VHQDLKPENVLLIRENGDKTVQVKISDLEECASIDKVGWRFSRGTEGYIAPERVLHCLPLDCSVDMWSLGIIIRKLFHYKQKQSHSPALHDIHDIHDIRHVSQKEDLDLHELIECFSFVAPEDRQKIWQEWCVHYCPAFKGSFKSIVSTNSSHNRISLQVGTIGEKLAWYKHESQIQILNEIIQGCLQLDPLCRVKIHEVKRLLHPWLSHSLLPPSLPPSIDVDRQLLCNVSRYLGKKCKLYKWEHQIDTILLESCPELVILKDQRISLLEKIQSKALYFYGKWFLMMRSVRSQRSHERSHSTRHMMSACLWLACHLYMDVHETIDRSSIWITWSFQVKKYISEILSVL
jgi:serine/threonine protein kinase